MAEPVGAGGPVVVDTGSERHLKKSLGYWQLTAVGFSGIIGSGWLLGAMGAAQIAGPESLVSWVIGAVVLALIALVMGSLGGARPEAGGLVRWPFYSNGRFVGTRLSPPCWAWRPGGRASAAASGTWRRTQRRNLRPKRPPDLYADCGSCVLIAVLSVTQVVRPPDLPRQTGRR